MLEERYLEIMEAASALSLQKVICDVVPLHCTGGEWYGPCPIHKGLKTETSFKLNPRKGVWKCFHCGEGGNNPIQFYQKLYGLNFTDAMMKLAARYGIVSADEYSEYLTKTGIVPPRKSTTKKTCTLTSTEEKSQEPKSDCLKTTESSPKLPIFSTPAAVPFILNAVYSTFIETAPPMEEYERGHLMNTRYLDEKDMKDFFIFPANTSEFWQNFKKNMKKKNISLSCLRHVPGFYYNQVMKCYSFNGYYAGKVGIVFRDMDGLINGIQIYNDETHKKYLWFSSSNAMIDPATTNTGWIYGTKNNGDPDVMPSNKTSYIACTEGKYKAIKLHDMGLYTLNLFGVGAWSPQKVDAIAKKINCHKLLLCYDTDCMEFGHPVMKSAVKFSCAMHDLGYEIQFAIWDPQYGKGIDDVINAGFKDKLYHISFDEFIDYVNAVA